MEPIRVPAPPKSAFNKSRPVGGLIRAQIKHFKHLENKLSAELRQEIPQHAIVTENDAARYIAAMTRLFHKQPLAAARIPARPAGVLRAPIPIRPEEGLALAAAAEDDADEKSDGLQAGGDSKPEEAQ